MKRTLVGVALVALLGIPSAVFAQSSKPADERRGDVGIGYSFMHDTGLSLPAGFVISDAWRLRRNFDVVLETGYNHGSVLGIGMNVFGLAGGARMSYPMPSANGTAAFGQVLMGLAHNSASLAGQSASVNGFNIQPGFGVEVPVNQRWGVRPQFDVMIQHAQGAWGSSMRVGVSAVFKIANTVGK